MPRKPRHYTAVLRAPCPRHGPHVCRFSSDDDTAWVVALVARKLLHGAGEPPHLVGWRDGGDQSYSAAEMKAEVMHTLKEEMDLDELPW